MRGDGIQTNKTKNVFRAKKERKGKAVLWFPNPSSTCADTIDFCFDNWAPGEGVRDVGFLKWLVAVVVLGASVWS